jgi:hypothetical protein
MRSPDRRRLAPLSGEAKHPVGARPSKCIIRERQSSFTTQILTVKTFRVQQAGAVILRPLVPPPTASPRCNLVSPQTVHNRGTVTSLPRRTVPFPVHGGCSCGCKSHLQSINSGKWCTLHRELPTKLLGDSSRGNRGPESRHRCRRSSQRAWF